MAKIDFIANQTPIRASDINTIQNNVIDVTNRLNAKVRFVENITVPASGWSNLTKQVNLSNTLLSSDTPHICLSNVNATTREHFGFIAKAETVGSNGIKFTCLEQFPTVDLVLQVEVIR